MGRKENPICEKVTNQADKSDAQLNDGFIEVTREATGGESAKLCMKAGCATDKAEDVFFGAIEDMGKEVGRKQQDPNKAGESAGEERGTDNVEFCTESANQGSHVEICSEIADHGIHVKSSTEFAGEEKGADSVEICPECRANHAVLNVEQTREQNENGREEEMGEEREAAKILGDGGGVYALVERDDNVDEMKGAKMLDIQPLAIMGVGGIQSVSSDWVSERVLQFCQELGLICDGHEEQGWQNGSTGRPVVTWDTFKVDPNTTL